MRANNDLDRLSAAAPAQLAHADSLVDAGEEDTILAGILASPRSAARRPRPRVRNVLVLAGVAAVAATVAAAASGVFGGSAHPVAVKGPQSHSALTGAKIQMAGYHFRTPAGFKASKASKASCDASSAGSAPDGSNGFAAAASADGGCLVAGVAAGDYAKVPADAQAVDVGAYQGFYVPPDSSGVSRLYVKLPQMGEYFPYLVLGAEDLTEQQLIAVAASGLPGHPGPGITTVCSQNCG